MENRFSPSNFNISQETLEKALANMKAANYIPEEYTVEDLIDYTYCMVEGVPFMVKRKIMEWAQGL